MKKLLVIASLGVVALLALGLAGLAYAQTQTPEPSPQPGGGRMMNGGPGGMRGNGMMGGWRGQADGERGPLHTYMVAEMAEAFELTVEELEARLAAGDTLWTIAEEKGLTAEQFGELMLATRTDALAQAVADGVITQEQADWMAQRMQQRMSAGFGPGTGGCKGQGGRMGGRWGRGPAATPPGQ